MRSPSVLIAGLGLLSAPASGAAQAGTAFVGATVVTMTGEGTLADRTVLVRGDTIMAIGPRTSLPVPAGYRRVDAVGRWLIPGLIDSHVHLAAESDLRANLRYGVTTVLQMSGRRGDSLDFLSMRDRIDRGELAGPRLVLTGPLFDVFGLRTETTAYAIPSLEAVPAVIAAHVARGYDFFKVHNRVPLAVYRRLVGGGRPIVGHIPMGMSIDEALRGQVMIAHAELFYYNLFGFRSIVDSSCADGFWPCVARARADPSVLDALAARVKRAGVAVTANLSYLAAEERVYRDFEGLLADPDFAALPPVTQQAWRRDAPASRSFLAERRQDLENRTGFTRALVARFAAEGVPILAGTDAPLAGLFPGRALHLELAELVRAGLSAEAALRTATAAPGAFLGSHVSRLPAIGRIQVGGAADLVLLDADPLRDISATDRIAGVMSRGIWRPAASGQARDEGSGGAGAAKSEKIIRTGDAPAHSGR
ncbi:MAG: amidohydrolase family protein [Gemmatimonadales bacterium]